MSLVLCDTEGKTVTRMIGEDAAFDVFIRFAR
jgi:hypothetical protein